MKISVIMPVYNTEPYIGKCLQSVINQTYKNWELIAIDDGSKDFSYDILCDFAMNDNRIIVETKENEGPGITRNRALDKATGDYIVFLDSDDYLEPDYFELLSECVKTEKADVIFIDVIQETPDGRLIKFEKMSSFNFKNRKKMLGCQMTGNMPWGGVRKAALRDLIEKYHLRYTDQSVGEEAIFSFDLLRNATRIGFIEKYLYHYINHPGSQSKSKISTWDTTLVNMRNHLEKEEIRDEYSDCLNAFAFTVLVSWLIRSCQDVSVFKCRRNFAEKIKKFELEYGWRFDKQYLRKELRLIEPFVKNRLLLPVIIAAKMKN